MERGAWTDQRLNDRFDHLDGEISDLRQDMRALRGEVVALRSELRGEIAELRDELRGEITEVRSLMVRLHATTLVVMVGLFAALFARAG
jgi:predicted  nucleic acid-binding Zn-ribbon protein